MHRNVTGVPVRHASLLEEELHVTRPFRNPGQEALLSVLRTADTLRRFLNGVLEPYGVTFQQYNVLRILRGAGPEGLPTLTIASRMIERTPGITRLIDRLERKKLAQRVRSGRDRRRIYCSILPAGLELLARLDEPVAAADVRAVRPLTDAQRQQLIELLARVRAGHAEPAPKGD